MFGIWKIITLSKRKYYENVLIVDKERNDCQESKIHLFDLNKISILFFKVKENVYFWNTLSSILKFFFLSERKKNSL